MELILAMVLSAGPQPIELPTLNDPPETTTPIEDWLEPTHEPEPIHPHPIQEL